MIQRSTFHHALKFVPLALLLASGCGGGGFDISDPVTGGSRIVGNLEFVSSTTQRSFASGEIVPVTLTVVNVGTTTVTGTYRGCHDSDVRVLDSTENTKWLASAVPGACVAVVRPFSIEPGKTLSLTVNWDQHDGAGAVVPAGTYRLKTWFNGFFTDLADFPAGAGEGTAYAPSLPILLSR